MKNSPFLSLVRRIAVPVAVMVFGLILLVNPDSASGLLGRLLGWCLVLGGLCFLGGALTGGGTAGKVLSGLVCLALGFWLLRNPMALARGVGRFLGILLAIRGVQECVRSASGGGKALGGIMAALGAVLILLPMTTSRLVFSLCGGAVLAVGVGMLINRLREDRGGDDPNIIDAL